jgi:hypothetical protein
MRIALVVVVLAFLYLVVWIGTRAFGSGAKQVTRIDRVIIDATALPPSAAHRERMRPVRAWYHPNATHAAPRARSIPAC